MSIKMINSMILIISLGILSLYSQSHDPATIDNITGKEALFHVKFLASDELRGRETFSREQFIAARYIANELEKYGLRPVIENQGFYQVIEMKYAKVDTSNRLFFNGKHYNEGKDFQVAAVGHNRIRAEVVFVGYGLSWKNYDSYANVDVKNKIVMVMEGKVHKKGKGYSLGSLHPIRVANAIKHGAIGMLFVTGISPKDRKMPISYETSMGELSLISSIASRMGLVRWDNSIWDRWFAFPLVYISEEVANDLLAATGKKIKEIKDEIDKTGKPQSFASGEMVEIRANVSYSRKHTMNVAGLIEGRDPDLKDEVIIIGAHYDHIGQADNSGEVYRGADDNASGTAILLEIAQAFIDCPEKPRRSILCIAFTGEEKGLLGSQYYVNHPLIPVSKTIAMFNLDMVGRNDENQIQISYKGFNADFLQISTVSSRIVGIGLIDSPENLQMSADHFPFMNKGVPVVFYFDGGGDFLHKPADRWDKLSEMKLQKVARLCFLTAYEIANRK